MRRAAFADRANLILMKRTALLLVAFFAAGCSERARTTSAGNVGGTLVIATTADPGTLFPPLVKNTQAKQITEQIYDYLADVGPGMNTRGDGGFRAALTDGWRWSPDSLSIAFHINPRARWHDARRVTAHDVVFSFSAYTNPAFGGSLLSDLANIDSVTAADSLTAVFWFRARNATQFLDGAAQMLILPAHLLASIPVDSLRENPPSPIGTGRFRLHRWNHGASVELVADSENYRGRARLDRVIWSVSPEFATAVTNLFSGNADLFENLRAEDLEKLSGHPTLRAVTLPGTDYAFLQFNLRDPRNPARPNPLFGDRELRRAISMAIDRESLVRNVFDTLAAVAIGPAVLALPMTDPAIPQIPFDTARARSILDSLGWRQRNTSGVRMRNGKQLAFTISVPTSSRGRMKMAVLLQEQLRRAGIAVRIDPMDAAAHWAQLTRRSFDASLNSWHMGASPDGTRQGWTAEGLGKDGVNFGGYHNSLFDAQLDTALAADSANARAAFTRALTTIVGDAPAVWLYDPKTVIGVHKRIRTGQMRPDSWWFDLGSWWIPEAERVARDRIGLER